MQVEDRIKKAHIDIMQHKKFCSYAGILACGSVEVTKDIPTAATDGWNVVYNPEFIETHAKTQEELRFLVLHEATHKAYRHLSVWQSLNEENPKKANIAADHFVNLALTDMDAGEGFIKMLDVGVVPDEQYRGMSVKQIFDLLEEDEGGEEGGEGGEEGFDEHEWGKAKDQGKEIQEGRAKEIERAIRQGEIMRRKLAGKGANNADGAFGDILNPKIDWRKVLREFIQEVCQGRDEASWRRPNRRYLAEDIYMPSMLGVTMTELVIGFDTSGSCFGGAEMTRFVSEIKTIIEDVKPSKTHVIYWDTEIAGHQIFEEGQFAIQDLKPKGGGGTDGAVLFDYLRAERIRPQAIIQFSDGYVGDWGTSDCPTMWALTSSNIRSPYGTTIYLED
jgi:predicted metal-dependent peptidase